MGTKEVKQYLTYLATKENVAGSTQNIALNEIISNELSCWKYEMKFKISN